MERTGEENEEKAEEQNDRSANDAGEEFTFYLQFTKPLVLELAEPEERAIAAAWVRKIESYTPEDQELRTNYLKLLLFVLQRGRLSGIFSKQPPAGPLQNFPPGFTIYDMGNLILDQEDMQSFGAGDARAVNYEVDVSNNLREYIAGQEIPNFGIQMYYAWSADDPVHKWMFFDEDKFPPFVIEKIKILKEIQDDEKAISTESPKERRGNSSKKKECELSFLDKLSKKKVKSPQEIESAQGRSFHTYMGLVGRMGNFNPKCDEDVERCVKPQQQSRGKCPRRIRRSNQGECEDDQNFQNFAPGGSEGLNAQNRPCLCPYPCHHVSCPEHRAQGGGGGQQDCVEPSSRPGQGEESDSEWCGPGPSGYGKKQSSEKYACKKTGRGAGNFDQYQGSSGCPTQYQMGPDPSQRSTPSSIPTPACVPQTRRSPSPGPIQNLQIPSPGNSGAQGAQGAQAPFATPPDQRGCSGGTDYCTCPCPRIPTSVGPTSSVGAMGGRSGSAAPSSQNQSRSPEPNVCPPGPGPSARTPEGNFYPAGPSNRQMENVCPTGQTPKFFDNFYPPITSTRTVDIFPPAESSKTVDICPSGAAGRPGPSYRTPENVCPSQPSFVKPQIIVDCYDTPSDGNFVQYSKRSGNECPEVTGTQQQYLTAEDPCFDEPSPDKSRRDQRQAMLAAARQGNTPIPGQKVLFEKSSSPEPGPSPVTNPPQEGFRDPRYLCPNDFGTDGEGPGAARFAALLGAPRRQPPTSPNLECPPNTPRSPGYTPIKQWTRRWEPLEPIGEVHVYPQPYTEEAYKGCPIGRTVNLTQPNANEISKACATQNETMAAMVGGTQVIPKTQVIKAPQCEEAAKQQLVDCLPPVSKSQLEVDMNYDFSTYASPSGGLKPNVYYTPQQKKRHGGVLHSPFSWGYQTSLNSSRDIASQPDRTYLGVGPFHPLKKPTQAQPLPPMPTPKYCINYDALKKQRDPDGMSLWYGVCPEEEELRQIRGEDQEACYRFDEERNAEGSQFENEIADKGIAETRRQVNPLPPVREASPPPTGTRSTRREQIVCSTPIKKNFNAMVFDESTISSIAAPDSLSSSYQRFQDSPPPLPLSSVPPPPTPPPTGTKSTRREQFLCSTPIKKSYNTLPFDVSIIPRDEPTPPSIPRYQEQAPSPLAFSSPQPQPQPQPQAQPQPQTPPPTGTKSTRREQFLCSTPIKKSYNTLPFDESSIHPMEISEMGPPLGQTYVISRNDDNCPLPYNVQGEMQAQSRSPGNRNPCYYPPGESS